MATLDDFAKQKAEFFKQKRQEQLGQVNAAAQEQQDVIQRRFASLGAKGSGAQFGVQQKAAEQAAAQRRQVEQDILGQQVQAAEPDLQRRFAAEQAQLAREYGTQERLGSEKFQTGQLTQQQQFQAGQLTQQQQFQAGQQALQNKFLSGESAASRDLQSRLAADDLALKKSLADMQNAKDQQTYELAKKQFEVDLETTNFNKILALVMAGIPYNVASASIKSAVAGAGAGSPQSTVTATENLFLNPTAYSGSLPQASGWSSNLGLGVY